MAAVCSHGRDGEDTALRKRPMGAPQPAKWGKNRELGMGARRGEHLAQSSGQDGLSLLHAQGLRKAASQVFIHFNERFLLLPILPKVVINNLVMCWGDQEYKFWGGQ